MPPEQKVGREFAVRVAERLKTKSDVLYDHRDYCGMGLVWYKDEFTYCRIRDGRPDETIHAFKDQEKFVDWLAEQTNTSLAGLDETEEIYRNNQRITLTRLFEFVNSKPRPRIWDQG